MTRPRIRADVAAALTAAIPSRLVKKLDAEPTIAEKWTWHATHVVTDKGETVKLTVEETVVIEVVCSCLLQPKCLHVAAVISILEPAEAPAAPAIEDSAVADAAPPAVAEPVHADVPAAAKHALRTVSDVLAMGAESSGAFAQAELLRAIHACKSAGLHRLSQTLTRALRSIRDLRADRAQFSLGVLTSDLRDALAVAHQVAAGDASSSLVGSARREYEAVGNLRVRGVFTEAVIARTGYAGAVTYLVDDKGRFYTRSDVAPGDAGRAAGAYDAAAGIGDAVLPHRALCRTGLFVSDATASADGRLGAGQRVRAVRASEPSRWDQLALRFDVPLHDQLAQIAKLDAEPEDARPAGWDLVFLNGMIVGGNGDVGVIVGETPIHLTTSLDHRSLYARDNLLVLSKASGLKVRLIGRVALGARRQLDLLAIGPAADETRFTMPEEWHGRANLHYDKLAVMALGAPPDVAVSPAPPTDDLLSPLRRRVERAVLGGAGTLPTHAIAELEREAAMLADKTLHGGAAMLRDLAALAHDASRNASGVRRPIDRSAFARAWLRAALYEDAARRRLSVASW